MSMYSDLAPSDGLERAAATLEEELKALDHDVSSVRRLQLRCGLARHPSRLCLVLCGVLALLVGYVGSAAMAATALTRGTTATLQLRSTEHLCSRSVLVKADLRATNPSSWAASLRVEEFSVRNASGALALHAGSAAISPAVLSLPPDSPVTIPVTFDLEIVDVPTMGAMLHDTFATGQVDIAMGLKYAGGLDMFPYTVQGTLLIQVKTGSAVPRSVVDDSDQSRNSDVTAPIASPESPAESSERAGRGGKVDKVVTVDELHFGTELQTIEPLVVSDTGSSLKLSTKATLSASWPVALMLSTFRLPPVRMVARIPTVSLNAPDAATDAIGAVTITQYKLPATYTRSSKDDTRLEVWIEAEILAEQVVASRRFARLLLSDNSSAVPLELQIDSGDCAALQCVNAMVGRLQASITPLFANGQAPGTGLPASGDKIIGGNRSTVNPLYDAVGLVVPVNPVPIQVLSLANVETRGAKIVAGVQFHSAGLCEHLLRAITSIEALQTTHETKPFQLVGSVALETTECSDTAATCNDTSVASGKLEVGFSWSTLTSVMEEIIEQAGPAISNGRAVQLMVPGEWQISLAANGDSTLSRLLDQLAVKIPRRFTSSVLPSPARHSLPDRSQHPHPVRQSKPRTFDGPGLPNMMLLARTDATGESVNIAFEWPAEETTIPWPVAITSKLGVRVYVSESGLSSIPRTPETLACEIIIPPGGLSSSAWRGNVSLWRRGLQALGSQAVRWAHRDAQLNIGLDAVISTRPASERPRGHANDVTALPLDIVLPQPGLQCPHSADSQAPTPGPTPPSTHSSIDELLGFDSSPPAPPPHSVSPTEQDGDESDGDSSVVLGSLLLADHVDVDMSALLGEVQISARLYNPLDIAVTILDVRLPLKKVNRNAIEEIISVETLGIPGHLKRPDGYGTNSHSTNHVSLPPHAQAVPITITFGVDHVSQLVHGTEVNIDRGVIRVAIGEYPTNSMDMAVMFNIEDVFGVRCHGINGSIASDDGMDPAPTTEISPSTTAPPSPPHIDTPCNATTPVPNGSACPAGIDMDTCTIHCVEGYGTRAGMAATYLCYAGEWVPMLGPLTCARNGSVPPPTQSGSRDTPPPPAGAPACSSTTPVSHGSACPAGIDMDTCKIQCTDGGTHAGMAATYLCYTGEWVPMLGPLLCI